MINEGQLSTIKSEYPQNLEYFEPTRPPMEVASRYILTTVLVTRSSEKWIASIQQYLPDDFAT